MTSARQQIISSLADKQYRDAFVSEDISQGLAFQIRAMRTDHGLNQGEFGELTGMHQARISQIENPDYERMSLTTLKRLASALDVALIVRFAPFSELVDWSLKMAYSDLAVPEYDRDPGFRDRESTVVGAHRTIGVSAVPKVRAALGSGRDATTEENIVNLEEYTRNRNLSQAGGTAPSLALSISG